MLATCVAIPHIQYTLGLFFGLAVVGFAAVPIAYQLGRREGRRETIQADALFDREG